MLYSKKSGKLLNIAFVIIGILLAACVICFANFSVVDDTTITADDDYCYLTASGPTSYYTEKTILQQGFENGYIKNAQTTVQVVATISKSINFNEQIAYSFPISLISALDENHAVRIGKLPEQGEIIISRKYADTIIKKHTKYFPDYDSLIGYEILLTADEKSDASYNFDNVRFLKISGISENTTNLAYINDHDYMSMIQENIFLANNTKIMWRDWQIENAYGKTYTIVAGRDMTEADINTHNVLVPSSLLNAESYVGTEYVIEPKPYENSILPPETYYVVGVYKLNGYKSNSIEFIGSFSDEIKYNDYTDSYQAANAHNYTLLDGNNPTNYNECITSIYSSYNIGDSLPNGKTVVGKYAGDYNAVKSCVLYHRDYIIYSQHHDYWFTVINDEQMHNVISEVKSKNEALQDLEFELTNSYDVAIAPLKEEQKADMLLYGFLSVGILIILAIIIYFMMRGRMIADISHIGVYRSLGQTRSKIAIEYVVDIIITVTLTSLIGFLLAILIFNSITLNMNNTLLISAADKTIELMPLGILLLYGLNIFFGLVPITNLLKMTPAEINSKYDM